MAIDHATLLRQITAAREQGTVDDGVHGLAMPGEDRDSQIFLRQWQAIEAHCDFRDQRVPLLLARIEALEKALRMQTRGRRRWFWANKEA